MRLPRRLIPLLLLTLAIKGFLAPLAIAMPHPAPPSAASPSATPSPHCHPEKTTPSHSPRSETACQLQCEANLSPCLPAAPQPVTLHGAGLRPFSRHALPAGIALPPDTPPPTA
ncbi:MAG: hypothetical protein AB7U30_06515 [Sulfuricellaceae bacterium]